MLRAVLDDDVVGFKDGGIADEHSLIDAQSRRLAGLEELWFESADAALERVVILHVCKCSNAVTFDTSAEGMLSAVKLSECECCLFASNSLLLLSASRHTSLQFSDVINRCFDVFSFSF